MNDLWWIYALTGSFAGALYVYINQILRLNPHVAMIYRGVVFFVLLLSIFPLFTPIQNPLFYLFCIIQGFIISIADTRMFRLSKVFGGEATSLYQPLSIGAVFFLWLLINPRQMLTALSHPLSFAAEIICLLIVSYAMIKLKKAKISKRIIRFLLPLVIVIMVNDVMNKKCMDAGAENIISAIYYYNLITSFVIGGCALFNYQKYKVSHCFFDIKSLLTSIIFLIMITLVVITKNTAMFYTPNPAYATAILSFAPLWIIGVNQVLQRYGLLKSVYREDPRYMIMAVLGIIFMILIVNG